MMNFDIATLPSSWTPATIKALAKLAAQRQAPRRTIAYSPIEVFTAATNCTPDEWQRRVMLDASDRVILNCARQQGKTEVAAAIACAYMVNNPGCTIAVLAPKESQSAELVRRVRMAYHAIGRPYPVLAESVTRLELNTGARIVALPGTERGARGLAADILIVDECSKVSDETLAAALPMLLATRGRLLVLSTPWLRVGSFYEWWQHGGTEWSRHRLSVHDNPRMTTEQIEGMRRTMPRFLFATELELAWLEEAAGVFGSHLIDQAFAREVTPLW